MNKYILRLNIAGLVLIGCLAFPLIACSTSNPQITGKTNEEIKASIERIKNELPSGKRVLFEDALEIWFKDVARQLFEGAFGEGVAPSAEDLVLTLSGKTVDEMIAQAAEMERVWKAVTNKRNLIKLQETITELEKLREQKSSADEKKALIDRIKISDEKFYFSESEFLKQPVVDMYVLNGTEIALKSIFFHGVLKSPGRTIPWVDENFNYTISGGLEPGEKKHLKLAPNMFSEWGNSELKEKKDLILTVTAKNAWDAKENYILPLELQDIDGKIGKLEEKINSIQANIAKD